MQGLHRASTSAASGSNPAGASDNIPEHVKNSSGQRIAATLFNLVRCAPQTDAASRFVASSILESALTEQNKPQVQNTYRQLKAFIEAHKNNPHLIEFNKILSNCKPVESSQLQKFNANDLQMIEATRKLTQNKVKMIVEMCGFYDEIEEARLTENFATVNQMAAQGLNAQQGRQFKWNRNLPDLLRNLSQLNKQYIIPNPLSNSPKIHPIFQQYDPMFIFSTINLDRSNIAQYTNLDATKGVITEYYAPRFGLIDAYLEDAACYIIAGMKSCAVPPEKEQISKDTSAQLKEIVKQACAYNEARANNRPASETKPYLVGMENLMYKLLGIPLKAKVAEANPPKKSRKGSARQAPLQ